MTMNALEQLRWKFFPVLDNGSVCLVDAFGDDSSVVQAARVCYADGTQRVSDDRTLIRYLLRHRHTTPFEMAEIKLLIRIPMDSWRQWIRHRTASVNETSTRYSVAIDAMQATAPDKWRLQSAANRQGSDGFVGQEIGQELSKDEAELQEHAKRVYQRRLELGVAREQARKDLPLSTYTEAYWKMDLHNLLHFLELRMDSHAQLEIRQYANIIGYEIVSRLFPMVWEAFVDYRLESVDLTRLDREVIKLLSLNKNLPCTEENFLTAANSIWAGLTRCRERDECRDKLIRLGLM